MVNGRNKGSSADVSFVKPGTSRRNLSSFQSQAVRSEAGKNFTEMGGRGSSDFYRNTSEELFLKSLMESSIGMPVPTMEMLGFKNLSQNIRTDSEELFKTWLTNGEASHCTILIQKHELATNHGYNSTSIVHCTRHTSQRMPTELAGSSGQQLGGVLQRKQSNDNLFPQNTALVDEQSSDMNQNSIRNVVERGLQASNLYLAKAWFHSSQPMTRSRSSELRRRYASMQNSQTSLGVEVMHNVSGHGVNNLKQEFANPNGFGDVSRCEIPNYFNAFMSPSNSASSTFNAPHTDNIDKVSSVVSMLKGTLEHKKLNNETVEDSSLELYGAQEFLGDMSLNQGQGNRIHETSRTIQDVSSVQVNDHGVLEAVEGSLDVDLDGFVNPTNPMQMSMVSREPSQSESSAAAPAVSTGFDVCDEPTNLGQTMSIGESSKKQVGNGRSSENGTRAKDIKERIDDNLKDDQKICTVAFINITYSNQKKYCSGKRGSYKEAFAMDLPTRFACMARLVAKITPDPWLIIKPALHDASSALFPSDFGKYFANGWERRSANNSSSHFIELNIEAGKKLVNTAVFHSFLVVVAVVNRFPFVCVEDVKILPQPFQRIEIFGDRIISLTNLSQLQTSQLSNSESLTAGAFLSPVIMAEAKERNLTPPIPSDMQSILKRCENLEKEVRSLKLNLSFMNRKDSEQTKQIEELQKQNEELTEDKEHLLEEIERIIAEPGKILKWRLGLKVAGLQPKVPENKLCKNATCQQIPKHFQIEVSQKQDLRHYSIFTHTPAKVLTMHLKPNIRQTATILFHKLPLHKQFSYLLGQIYYMYDKLQQATATREHSAQNKITLKMSGRPSFLPYWMDNQPTTEKYAINKQARLQI
ncbi:hypothetical protein HYC85_023075 [Camellia sinensis]|uniref:Uncharacterized protein n=1 Tax=Camellia sinensis TaxID=4442 RepID=A0A7J7GHF3_CAMSI|nr:hypothetical protein HYC85_023075 [Camellia sinensis]